MKKSILLIAFACLFAIDGLSQYKMEYLNRGIVAVNGGDGKIFVSWRLLGTEDPNLSFNLYRTTKGKTIRLNKTPITKATNFTDETADSTQTNVYLVKVINNSKEERTGISSTLPPRANPYLAIPLRTPAGYSANDASVGDMDGDGAYEIVIHLAGRGRDNSQQGITDPPVFQCYKLDGTFLWQINLGKNI